MRYMIYDQSPNIPKTYRNIKYKIYILYAVKITFSMKNEYGFLFSRKQNNIYISTRRVLPHTVTVLYNILLIFETKWKSYIYCGNVFWSPRKRVCKAACEYIWLPRCECTRVHLLFSLIFYERLFYYVYLRFYTMFQSIRQFLIFIYI